MGILYPVRDPERDDGERADKPAETSQETDILLAHCSPGHVLQGKLDPDQSVQIDQDKVVD